MRVNLGRRWMLTDEHSARPGQPVLVNTSTHEAYTPRMAVLIDPQAGPTSAAYGVTRLSRNTELTPEEREFLLRFTRLR